MKDFSLLFLLSSTSQNYLPKNYVDGIWWNEGILSGHTHKNILKAQSQREASLMSKEDKAEVGK